MSPLLTAAMHLSVQKFYSDVVSIDGVLTVHLQMWDLLVDLVRFGQMCARMSNIMRYI